MEKLIVLMLIILVSCSSTLTKPQKEEVSVDFDQINSGIKRSLRKSLNGTFYKINRAVYLAAARTHIKNNQDDKLFLETFDKEQGKLLFKGQKYHFFACAELTKSELILCDYTKKGFAKMYDAKETSLKAALKVFSMKYKK